MSSKTRRLQLLTAFAELQRPLQPLWRWCAESELALWANPLSSPPLANLRAVFLKTDNFLNGRYFAELTKEIMEGYHDANVKSEFRLSIYGRSASEWKSLAQWVDAHDLYGSVNRFLIQIPRLYDVWHRSGVASFDVLLDNIFRPLFEATLHPAAHRVLFRMLTVVRYRACCEGRGGALTPSPVCNSGFDCVDDESKSDSETPVDVSDPVWARPDNPPYSMWMYYLHANIAQLNVLRKLRNLPLLTFRPHAGEAGSVTHLADCFLLATRINHGIGLAKSCVDVATFFRRSPPCPSVTRPAAAVPVLLGSCGACGQPALQRRAIPGL